MTATMKSPTWATEIRQLDNWQDAAHRREVATVQREGETTVVIEQDIEPGSTPTVRIEVDGMRVAGFHDAASIDALIGALGAAKRDLEKILGPGDRSKVSIRPGVLDAIAEALDVSSDRELAAAVRLEPVQIERLRGGGKISGDEVMALSILAARLGLRSSESYAMNWVMQRA